MALDINQSPRSKMKLIGYVSIHFLYIRHKNNNSFKTCKKCFHVPLRVYTCIYFPLQYAIGIRIPAKNGKKKVVGWNSGHQNNWRAW